jgi:glycosyltransferase involved in cell wall biosynthesis
LPEAPPGDETVAPHDAAPDVVVSVVVPTYLRPREVDELLASLAGQDRLPDEVLLVDGAPPDHVETADVVRERAPGLPFAVRHLRSPRGTAVQRNLGIDVAAGRFVVFLDDDVRPDPPFLATLLAVFAADVEHEVGGVVGYRANEYFAPESHQRWRWYWRLGLLQTRVPGWYDYRCGYPINNSMQPPFSGTRPVDFMTTACAMWRRAVFDEGLRFDPFFRDYGVLEDAHLSLRARRRWALLQCGDATCVELHSPGGRVDRRRIGYKAVVNYWFVFRSIAGPLGPARRVRFWRYQAFELARIGASAVRRRRREDLDDVVGRLEGALAVARGAAAPESGRLTSRFRPRRARSG